MSMNPVPKDQEETTDAVAEFIKNGGIIQKIPYGQRSEIEYKNYYGRPKPKQKETEVDSDEGEE